MKLNYKKYILFGIICLFLFVGGTTNAEVSSSTINQITSAYRQYKEINNIPITVPTVIEIPFEQDFIERLEFAVLDPSTNTFKPYLFQQTALKIPISVNTDVNSGSPSDIVDQDPTSYAEFYLPKEGEGQAKIELSSTEPITSSALTLLLDKHVALPTSISIQSKTDRETKFVVAPREINQNTIRFPKTRTDNWIITLNYNQPLRITELRLNQENNKTSTSKLRFLAQPEHSYRIYFNPDRHTNPPIGEQPYLSANEDVLRLNPTESFKNPNYKIADSDKDGVADIYDNCVTIANPDQKDINSNNKGDACEDFDRDGIINKLDNCPNHPNQDQKDEDGDGIGDICDKKESRITERYKWLPWVGIGFAGIVLIILLSITTKSLKEENPTEEKNLNQNEEKKDEERINQNKNI